MRFTAVDVVFPGWSSCVGWIRGKNGGFLQGHDRHGLPPMRHAILGCFFFVESCLNKQWVYFENGWLEYDCFLKIGTWPIFRECIWSYDSKIFFWREMIQYDSYFSNELKPPSINFWLSTFIAVISLYSPWTVSSFTRYVRRSWWRPWRDPATLQHDALRPTFRFRHAVRMSSRRVSILGRESGSGGKVCLEEWCNHSNIMAGYVFVVSIIVWCRTWIQNPLSTNHKHIWGGS